MERKIKSLLLTLGVILIGVGALTAQPNRGNPGATPAPIDGGISLLLAAGAAFGGKKAFDAYKAKREID